ncbi:MAG: hypothetical protein AAF211_22030, partial [Myxococcota bacterium]
MTLTVVGAWLAAGAHGVEPPKFMGRAVASPDGQLLATRGRQVAVWDPRSGRPLEVLDAVHSPREVVFSGDGRLVMWRRGTAMEVYTPGSGEPVRSFAERV